MQQTANPRLAAAASIAAAQQVQTLIKFDLPLFKGDSAAGWLTLSQSVVYQVRACGFEAEVTAADREGLRVGADVFDQSNVDLGRLQNALTACMTLINNCRGVTLESVERSTAPNGA